MSTTVNGDHVGNYLSPAVGFSTEIRYWFNGKNRRQLLQFLAGSRNKHDKKLSLNSATFITSWQYMLTYQHRQTFASFKKRCFLNVSIFSIVFLLALHRGASVAGKGDVPLFSGYPRYGFSPRAIICCFCYRWFNDDLAMAFPARSHSSSLWDWSVWKPVFSITWGASDRNGSLLLRILLSQDRYSNYIVPFKPSFNMSADVLDRRV